MRQDKSRDRAHPGKGEWRAYADGEAGPLQRLRLRLHLAQCASCRLRLEAVQEAGVAASSLLRRGLPRPDLAESWARIEALTARSVGRPGMSPGGAFVAGGLAVASVAASVLILHPGPSRALARLHGEAAFASVLDECCSEEPGEAQPGEALARQGVLTLHLPGVDAPVRVHYMDVDRSGTLSSGDIVRTVHANGSTR